MTQDAVELPKEKFADRVNTPWNDVFRVVFFPDRIYHAQYLNATRSPRYRYAVREVRGKADINVLKGDVFLDGIRLCSFVRLEYRGARLAEVARERARFLGPDILADVTLTSTGNQSVSKRVRMHHCPWIDAYQVEFWETLEPPAGRRHDYQVLDLMGHGGSITRVPEFGDLLDNVEEIQWVNLRFRENDTYYPSGFTLSNDEAQVDNFFDRNIQDPSKDPTTVEEKSYGLNFRRGWFVKQVGTDVAPVRYTNAMMDADNPDRGPANTIEMRWVLQQELGGTVVFFHEVTIPPNTVEGTHQHIGSEELYYITEGNGVAYMGLDDDPQLAANAQYSTVTRHVYGIGPRECKQVPVGPGSVIYTKSGGIHGIANPNDVPLRFVAFLYHSA